MGEYDKYSKENLQILKEYILKEITSEKNDTCKKLDILNNVIKEGKAFFLDRYLYYSSRSDCYLYYSSRSDFAKMFTIFLSSVLHEGLDKSSKKMIPLIKNILLTKVPSYKYLSMFINNSNIYGEIMGIIREKTGQKDIFTDNELLSFSKSFNSKIFDYDILYSKRPSGTIKDLCIKNKVPLYMNYIFKEYQFSEDDLKEMMARMPVFKSKTVILGGKYTQYQSSINSMLKTQKLSGSFINYLIFDFLSDDDEIQKKTLEYLFKNKEKLNGIKFSDELTLMYKLR